MHRLRASGPLIVLAAVVAAAGCDGGFDETAPPFPPFREVDATKELALSVGAAPVRFRVPVRVSPPSFEARLEVIVDSAGRPLRAELLPEAFAGGGPDTWGFVSTGAQVQTFLSGVEREDLRLSLSRDAADVDALNPLRLTLRLVAPADVDFDGAEDGVEVGIDPLSPLVP